MATPKANSSPSLQFEKRNSSSIEDAEPAPEEAPSEDPRVPNFSDAPDGGTAAWLVAAGGSSIFFCCLGFANSFGSLAEYYLTHQLRAETPDNVAWIGSLSAFLSFAAGMVGGPLFDRFGAWVRPSFSLAFEANS